MTARQMPKYPFRRKDDATAWGGFTLAVIPLTALLVALVMGTYSSVWRASFCAL